MDIHNTSNRNSKCIPISKTPSASSSYQQKQRRQSIMLLSESVQSRRSSVFLGAKKSKRSQLSNNSVDSKIFVNINSPNFKTNHLRNDEIVNSLKNNYLNHNFSHSSGKNSINSSLASISAHSSVIDNDDYGYDSDVHNHGNTKENHDNDGEEEREGEGEGEGEDLNLKSPAGDITRDIYMYSKRNDRSKKNWRKNKISKKHASVDDLSIIEEDRRRRSTASAINVPGGFRREFIVQKVKNNMKNKNTNGHYSSLDNKDLEYDSDENDIGKIPFLTRNFLEFLYVYGHFAGESLEDEIYPPELLPDTQEPDDDDDDDATPLLSGQKTSKRKHKKKKLSAKGTTSTFKAFLLMIKSFIGTGVLFLPRGFSNGGLTFSIIMLVFFGIYSYWCYYILIQSKVATKVSSFGDIGAKLYGPWMKFIILSSLVLTQLGFSAAYVVFTAQNLMAFLTNIFHFSLNQDANGDGIKLGYLLAFQFIVFIPLSFIRNVSKLSLPSLFANFFIMGGLLIVIFFSAKHLIFDLHCQPANGIIYGFNPSDWSLFVGTAIFAFEGIGLIIPVQDSMKHPEKFPKVLLMVIITACVLFIGIATLGYISYGDQIETVILLNLPQTNIFVNLIQFFYSMAILLSTPLQLFPAIAIIESKVFPKFTKIYGVNGDITELRLNSGKNNWKIKWLKNTVRTFIVFLVVFIAYFGSNNLDKFVSIVGCFACIPLVYIYPPMLHLFSCSRPKLVEDKSFSFTKRFQVALDYILIVFGTISMLYTTYQCIYG